MLLYPLRPLFSTALICAFLIARAQVPVHEEPRHRPVFENRQIRILNVLIPPGDTTLYHIHHTPSVFILFTHTKTGSQLQGGDPATGTSTAGEAYFENLAPPHIRIHRVWNADKDSFHVIDAELLSADTGFVHDPLNLPHLKLEIDTPSVRVYRLTLSKGEVFTLPKTETSCFLVSLDTPRVETSANGKRKHQSLRQGNFFHIVRKQSFFIRNTGTPDAQFILLELPAQ